MEEFLKKMQVEVLDCEKEVTMDTLLHSLEDWDSFSAVAYIAMASSDYGVRVGKEDVLAAATVGDLYKLLGK